MWESMKTVVTVMNHRFPIERHVLLKRKQWETNGINIFKRTSIATHADLLCPLHSPWNVSVKNSTERMTCAPRSPEFIQFIMGSARLLGIPRGSSRARESCNPFNLLWDSALYLRHYGISNARNCSEFLQFIQFIMVIRAELQIAGNA